MANKGGLGKGIGALIPGASNKRSAIDDFFGKSSNAPSLNKINIDLIEPNQKNPRKTFNKNKLNELAGSIKQNGLLQPIVIRPINKNNSQTKYEIIMGERRFRAAKEAGLKEISAIIRNTKDNKMLQEALIENIHRDNLNAIEEAQAFKEMIEELGITHQQLSDKLCRSRASITNTLRLLKLSEYVQSLIVDQKLNQGAARLLLSIKDEETQNKFAKKIVENDFSVKQTEHLVQNYLNNSQNKKANIKAGSVQIGLKTMADNFSNKFNAPVHIKLLGNKGAITINFESVKQLNEIAKIAGIEEFSA